VKIAIFHYSYTPVVGGVEFVMEQHAALLARHGHDVRVISGEGESRREEVEVVQVRGLSVGNSAVAASQAEALAGDSEGAAFCSLRETLVDQIRAALDGIDFVFVHNVLTMHFNLAATAAIWELADEMEGVHFVNWVHDLAVLNPDYDLPCIGEFPCNLIVKNHRKVQAVAISRRRQEEFCERAELEPWECPVVPNGVEVMKLLELTEPVANLVRRQGILYRDIVLIQPTRILRRKNIELGIRVLAELKEMGHSVVYLVTGAPDPHNRVAREYGDELHELVREMKLESDVLFVGDQFPVSDGDLVSLYAVSDALFMPSRQEGFGLPLLEAGFFRLPAFCPRIEPMQSILEHNVFLFDIDGEPESIASLVAETLEQSRGHKSRKETLLNYSWERLFRKYIEPLFLKA